MLNLQKRHSYQATYYYTIRQYITGLTSTKSDKDMHELHCLIDMVNSMQVDKSRVEQSAFTFDAKPTRSRGPTASANESA